LFELPFELFLGSAPGESVEGPGDDVVGLVLDDDVDGLLAGGWAEVDELGGCGGDIHGVGKWGVVVFVGPITLTAHCV
jgi:hypothetical protein